MYIFILTIIIFIILLVVFLHQRKEKYKNFLDIISREKFTSKITKKKHINIKKNLPSNPNLVFCDYEGNTFYIKQNKIWKLKSNGEIEINSENLNNVLNLPESINIKTGTLQKRNLIILTHDNLIIEYDLIEREIISNTKVEEYFFNFKENIDCLLYYKNYFYIFSNGNIVIYNKEAEIIEGSKQVNEIFKNLPNNINCAFLNNNIVIENVTHGIPFFIKNKDLYFYNEIKNDTNLIDADLGFFSNTKFFPINFNNLKVTFKPPKNSLYRIITIGAGNEGGGYGGVVYNDYILSKKDILNIIIGKSGERLPLKDKVISHDKLPYTSSSAGSGGSFVYKKEKLLICSGGGGGWSSEIIKCPTYSNSYLSDNRKSNKIIIPIKKIVLTTKNTDYYKNNNIRQKIIVKNFIIDVFNYTQVDYNVISYPKINSTKYLYETDYNEYGNKSNITITFSKVLSDYTFKIDASVLSTNDDSNFFDLILYDERDRPTKIIDFNKNYNNKTISSKTIVNIFLKYPNTLNNNILVESGNSSSKKIDNLFKPNDSSDVINHEENIVILDGGVGGGGKSFFNKKNKNISCGGGGGFKGGEHISLSDEFQSNSEKYLNLDYCCASGGKSYISNNKFDEKCFIDDYNNSNGKVIIIQVDKIQTFSNTNKNSNRYLENTEKFIKPKYEPIFEKRMNKVKFEKSKYEIKRPSLNNNIRFDTINYKISTINQKIKPGINFFKYKVNPRVFDRNKLFIKCQKNIDVMILYFSIKNTNRIIIKDEKMKEDNILKLNHGMIDPSLLNVFTFLEKLIQHNIYKYVNNLNIEQVTKKNNNKNIKNLFDNTDLVYRNINFLYIDNDISKLNNVDYVYILFKTNEDCNIKFNFLEYNNKNNLLSDNELNKQISNF